ncbi:MAG TPA: type II toxin-antitoxin system RelE/ParE family toxin [Verrucomicrobiae bacterium]|nr:type II toxin-antitoxin system RelE/ParE family toxin [Verrucomicrobiae bacterium]
MTLNILPSTQEDLAAGFAFYEQQQSGVGRYFLESLISDIDSLAVTAGVHRKVFGFHRLLAKAFPYAIYYTFDQGTVEIRAVLDCRRNPSAIRQSLQRI